MNKIPVSSTFLYEFDIDKCLVDDYLFQFLNQKNISEYSVYHENRLKNPSTALSLTDREGNHVSFYDQKFFSYVQYCLDQVTSLYVNFDVKICDSWITKAKFSQEGNWHRHFNSMFSGVVYLTDHDNSHTEFQIQDSLYDKLTPWISPHIVKNNNYTIKYKPQRGKILIWPSTLLHRISVSRDKKTRYTFAFNSWISGEVSNNITGKLKVKIDL